MGRQPRWPFAWGARAEPPQPWGDPFRKCDMSTRHPIRAARQFVRAHALQIGAAAAVAVPVTGGGAAAALHEQHDQRAGQRGRSITEREIRGAIAAYDRAFADRRAGMDSAWVDRNGDIHATGAAGTVVIQVKGRFDSTYEYQDDHGQEVTDHLSSDARSVAEDAARSLVPPGSDIHVYRMEPYDNGFTEVAFTFGSIGGHKDSLMFVMDEHGRPSRDYAIQPDGP
jgi:hypothetical protein